ncbi:hypothetical protein E2C01_089538 [Portunus trituberculatus]|uniref:Uncharacterized protein n=1 Tax=Portunus trituberculatus TaxID=210409 RepID=A0A5B7J925_PORTR|nr:hypothetical protein [Portunus trituberculatus]
MYTVVSLGCQRRISLELVKYNFRKTVNTCFHTPFASQRHHHHHHPTTTTSNITTITTTTTIHHNSPVCTKKITTCMITYKSPLPFTLGRHQ